MTSPSLDSGLPHQERSETEPLPTRLQILKVAMAVEAGLAGLAFVLAWFCGRDLLAGIHLNATELIQGLLATGPLFLMLGVILKSSSASCVRIRQVLNEVLLPWLNPCRLVDLILLSTLAGVAEELMFRAFLQSLFADMVGTTAALVLASLLFGAAHWITTGYAILASIAGFYLGIVWIATGENTLAVMIAHGVYDLVALIVLLHRYRIGPGRAVLEVTGSGSCGPMNRPEER